MKKRIMMIMLTIMMLSSCYYADQVFGDIKESHEMAQSLKKNRGGAIYNEKYKSGVYEAINDIVKRPVNKKVQFEGTTLLIPENTRLNPKHGNIVDEKTGYGIAITFEITERCSSVYYRKKIKEGLYCKIYYNGINSELNIISKKIIETNGFTNTCK